VEWQKDRFMQVNTYSLKHANNPESIATKMYTCITTNFPLLAQPKKKDHPLMLWDQHSCCDF